MQKAGQTHVCRLCGVVFARKATTSRVPKFCGYACNKKHQNYLRFHSKHAQQDYADQFFESLVNHNVTGNGERDGLKMHEDWAISSQAQKETFAKVQRSPETVSVVNLSNRELYSACLGMVIGDAHIQKRSTGARINIAHARAQKGYAEFKARILGQIAGADPNMADTVHTLPKLGKSYDQVRLWTKVHPIFTAVRDQIYRPAKTLNSCLLKSLTPLGLAIWYMDDGHIQGNAVSLSTYSFTKEEHDIIRDWFVDVCDLHPNIGYDAARNLHYIRFRVSDSGRFIDIVRPYITQVDCMLYKLKYENVRIPKAQRAMGEGHERTAPVGTDRVMI